MSSFELKTSFRDRINYLMDIMGLASVAALARVAGVPTTTITSGMQRNSIGRKTALKLSKGLGISFQWVFTGEGSIEKRGTEFRGHLEVTIDEADQSVIDPSQRSPQDRVPRFSDELVHVPKAGGRLSTRGGLVLEEDQLPERFAFRRDWLSRIASAPDRLTLLDVDGDSMEPALTSGDTVLIDLGRTDIGTGGIFAIAVGEVVQIKRLDPLPGGKVRIAADNPAYYTYTADPDEVRVIGEMIWFGRTFT